MIQTTFIGSTTSNDGRLGAPKNPLVDTVLPLPEAVQMPVSVFIAINHMRARKHPCVLNNLEGATHRLYESELSDTSLMHRRLTAMPRMSIDIDCSCI